MTTRLPKRLTCMALPLLAVLTITLFGTADVQAQTCTPAPAGLVSWWPLDETSGTTSADIIDTNPGTHMNAPSFATGKVAGGLSFDGVDDFVSVADAANLKPTSITVDAWVKGTSIPTNQTDLTEYIVSKSGFNGNEGFELAITNNGVARVARFLVTTTVGFGDVEGTTDVLDGAFHHIAGTYDGSTISIYVDGAFQNSSSVSGLIVYSTISDPLLIGDRSRTARNTPFFSGVIDEVEIFDRALLAAEILSIADAGSAGKCKDTDGDGVNDGDDLCPGTVVPEENVPTVRLGTNRWTLGADSIFVTTAPKGKGPRRSYTIEDTHGCSCEQIIEREGLGKGHTKFGCSISAMDDAVNFVNTSKRGAGADAAEVTSVPEAFVLEANYPNPFNPQTTIRFGLPESAQVRLVVYDVLGREVRVLVDGTREAGTHEVVFEASNLPSGTYLVRLETPAGSFVQTMQLVK